MMTKKALEQKTTDSSSKTIPCEECDGMGTIMKARLFPYGHREVEESCRVCGGWDELEEEKANEVILNVDIERIKTISNRDDYLDHYQKKLLNLRDEINAFEEKIETRREEIEGFEWLIRQIS